MNHATWPTLSRNRAGAPARAHPEALRDAVALEQIVDGLGRAIADLVAPLPADVAGSTAATDPLREGYLRFLNVVGAEWRSSGESAAIASAFQDARAELRRAEWFAAVRANHGVLQPTCAGQRPCTSKVSRELRIIRVAERTLTLGSAALVRNCLAIVWQRTELDKFDRAAELGDGTQGRRQLILQGVVR